MKITVLKTPEFRLDGGAMFGVVPKILWAKHVTPDENNRIAMTTRIVYVETDNVKAIFDVGIGGQYPSKFTANYRIDESAPSLVDRLSRLGVRAEAITHVILTHLHFDHCGGLTAPDADGKWKPTFPNARHYLQRRNLDWARHGSPKDRASFFPERFEPIGQAGLLELLDGPTRLFDWLELIVFEGHTPAMQSPLIHLDETTRLFVPSDLIPMRPHVAIPWVMAFDLHPVKTIEEKQEILPHAVDRRWLVLLQHDPSCGLVHVERTDRGYTGTPVNDAPFLVDETEENS